jgi:DNA replication and repair protein RecF
MEVSDLRNIERAHLTLGPGLNVLLGRNAQGKTSLLEAVGLLARGRSFRTDQLPSLIRRGSEHTRAQACVQGGDRDVALEVQVGPGGRRYRVDGHEVEAARYHGRLEATVYSTDRLRVVRGPMRERRLYVDRAAAALWPSYRQLLRDYERIVRQRNAALLAGSRDLSVWDEQLVAAGAELRRRRAAYLDRLRSCLSEVTPPADERYGVESAPAPQAGDPQEEERLRAEMAARRTAERGAGRTLVGPHRDDVRLLVDGEDAGQTASSGQARSLLLVLTLAALALYRAERGTSAVALLDDLDSELDDQRATAVCDEVARHGQALVTTAHGHWARRLADGGRLFEVESGRVRAA